MRKQGIEKFQVEKNGYRGNSQNITPVGNRNEVDQTGAESEKEERKKMRSDENIDVGWKQVLNILVSYMLTVQKP